MYRPIYFILSIIFFNACGGGETNGDKVIPTSSPKEESEVLPSSIPKDDEYHSVSMNINENYEVLPNDIYIPIDKNTKLKIEYQLLVDKKYIMILNGKAILKVKNR